MILLLIKLLMMHALTDFSLQTDAMAKGKNRNKKPDYIPEGQKFVPCWAYWLSSHALISGGGVWIITGKYYWGITEIILHWMIDFIKCENKTNPHQDQLLHLLCRLVYCV